MPQTYQTDYHPGSNEVVLDIVHPSMFPFVEGVTTCVSPEANDFAESVYEKLRAEQTGEFQKTHDMWGRPYEYSRFQWLPSEFLLRYGAKSRKVVGVRVVSRINNLPTESWHIVPLLEELFMDAFPLFEKCYAYCRELKFPRQGGFRSVVISSETSSTSSYSASNYRPRIPRKSLFKFPMLQVITKIVEYELRAGQEHPDGAWHVEGMSHKNIVCTAVCVLRKGAAIRGGLLRFKRAFIFEETSMLEHIHRDSSPNFLINFLEEGLMPLGKVRLDEGDIVVFPNSHVHQLSSLLNTGSTAASRRVVVFWLINPRKRIVSTRHVDPDTRSFTYSDALKYRLELMEERRRRKQDWNVRKLNLCEH